MIKIYRKKDLTDFFMPYYYIVSGTKKKIYAGESHEINIEGHVDFIDVKYLYFKTNRILINKDIETRIILGSCIDNKLVILIIPFILLSLILMTYGNYELLNPLYIIAKYLAVFYFCVLIYFSTFGHKKYISVDIQYFKN